MDTAKWEREVLREEGGFGLLHFDSNRRRARIKKKTICIVWIRYTVHRVFLSHYLLCFFLSGLFFFFKSLSLAVWSVP